MALKITIPTEPVERSYQNGDGIVVRYKVRPMDTSDMYEGMDAAGVSFDGPSATFSGARYAITIAQVCVTELLSVTCDGETVELELDGKPVEATDPRFRQAYIARQFGFAAAAKDEAGALELKVHGERKNSEPVPA